MESLSTTEILLQLTGYGVPFARLPSDAGGSLLTHTGTVSPEQSSQCLQKLMQTAADHAFIAAKLPSLKLSSSVIIRAVAAEVSRHIRQFVQFVAEVEEMISHAHPSLMIEDAVSLIKLETIFSRPGLILAHLRSVTLDLLTVLESSYQTSPVFVLNRLRAGIITGYDDLKDVTRCLLRVVDNIMILQIKKWCLYGELYSALKEDFFIQPDYKNDFVFVEADCPNYIGRQVAQQIYSLGMVLLKIKRREHNGSYSGSQAQDTLSKDIASLSETQSPIDDLALLNSIARINDSLSKHILQHLLPRSLIGSLLTILQDYFLLSNGHFALALIERVEQDFRSLRNAVVQVKDTTVQALLAKTLMSLDAGDHDSVADAVTTSDLKMALIKDELTTDGTTFSDFLFGVHVRQSLTVRWPVDIFLTEEDLLIYGKLFDYLVALRRAHERLHSLWRGRRTTSTNSHVSKATWTTAFRARAFLGALLEYYHSDVIESFRLTWRTAIMRDDCLYDPLGLSREHGASLRDLSNSILLPDHSFGKIMRRLLISIDQMVQTVNHGGIAKRCSTVIDLLEHAMSELTMEQNVDRLLMRLQVSSNLIGQQYYH